MTKEEKQHILNLVETFKSYETDYYQAYLEDLDCPEEFPTDKLFAYQWRGYAFAYEAAANDLEKLVNFLDDK